MQRKGDRKFIRPLQKLSPSTNPLQGNDVASLELSIVNHLEFSLAKDEYSATRHDCYLSTALSVRDRLFERWIETQQTYYEQDAKRIYYISMEFLLGRLLGNSLINLGLYDNVSKALVELGYDLEEIRSLEADAGLGNGGLGRLAACFLDSMATLELPAYGYGLRYEFGIFTQKIVNGYQVEAPDHWLKYGNPWEIERPEYKYTVKFYGRVNQYTDEHGKLQNEWLDTDDVLAIAFDTPVPGYLNNTVNTMRLWSAYSSEEFNLNYFNHGDYEKAVADKIDSETISKLLYPRDEFYRGKELRLKQEYFLVSATIQDIIRRFKKIYQNKFEKFADKVAIQLNDTHPALVIPELMRILVDQEELPWDQAWEITTKTCAYTNHTVLPEALEKWSVDLIQHLLPRHMQIIYEINHRFLENIRVLSQNNISQVQNMSIIEEGKRKLVRMANLAIVGSHSVNGVAQIHTEILKNKVFNDFHRYDPDKINNKTNGITQRRWLKLSNPLLSNFISQRIGDKWITELGKLKELETYADDAHCLKELQQIKRQNKKKLAEFIHHQTGIRLDVDSIFDCQVKRIHEYKRQLLNVLHIVVLYNQLRMNPKKNIVPRSYIFSGKAAPGYTMAKLIIKLITSIGERVNNDESINDKLKVIFLPDYSVTLAQMIIPAADVSEQISIAGFEASGTGNMKFALNGALTVGTLDGANIEIMNEVGEDNIFIFGLKAKEVIKLMETAYDPLLYFNQSSDLRNAINLIVEGEFTPSQPELFRPIIEALLYQGDRFMLLADFDDYVACQSRVNAAYKNSDKWAKMALLNIARMGKFSSDRTIMEYANEIWNVKPVHVEMPEL
ncbi:glycogen/starch/alpha-glucan phosphorylase [candidate division KSB1 bacterium]|nr:glycogen/starch/alpha-glucan phosphorylase [candidate division KSB1 bacterium]